MHGSGDLILVKEANAYLSWRLEVLADFRSREPVEDAGVGLKDGHAQRGVVLEGLLIVALLLHHAQLLGAVQHGQHSWEHASLLHSSSVQSPQCSRQT